MNTKLIKKSFRNSGNFFRYHKKHILITMLAMVMLIGTMCFCGSGYKFKYDADGDGNEETYNTKDYSGFGELPFLMLDDISSADDLETVAKMTQVTYDNGQTGVAAIFGASDNATLSINGSQMSGLMDLIVSANGLAVVLAIWLLGITWGIGFMNQEFKGFQLEELAKRFLMLVIGLIGIFIAMNLSFFVMNLGATIANETAINAGNALDADSANACISRIQYEMISSATKTKNKSTWDMVWPAIDNFFVGVGYLFQMFIPWLVTKVSLILTKFTCWSRAFEMIILAVFSPFAFADVVDIHRIGMGTGSRFLKNMASLALSGTIIVLVLAMGKMVQLDLLLDFNTATGFGASAGALLDISLVALATAGLCMKAPQISKSVLGLG